MKKKFKLMLACEDEDGKGMLCPLTPGSLDLTYDPEANNFEALKALSADVHEKLHEIMPQDILPVVNKLLLGQK